MTLSPSGDSARRSRKSLGVTNGVRQQIPVTGFQKMWFNAGMYFLRRRVQERSPQTVVTPVFLASSRQSYSAMIADTIASTENF
jgi:hypothetical protein